MCAGFEVIPLMLDKDENKGNSQNHVCHCGGDGKFTRRMEEIRLSYRACVDRSDSESLVGFLRA